MQHPIHKANPLPRIIPGGPTPGQVVRRPRVRRGQDGRHDRQALAHHRQQDAPRVPLH